MRPEDSADPEAAPAELERERSDLLEEVERWLEVPLQALGIVWLGLVATELAVGLGPGLELAVTTIWILFLIDFAVRFLLAPRKIAFLRGNVLTAVSLALPGLRFLRFGRALGFLRAGRAVRGLRLLKLVGSVNRGMRALRASMSRRGFGYVALLTLLVTIAGAAGMLQFERDVPGSPQTFGEALWWTAMLMTTIASEYWPKTSEGRLLCLLLSAYALAMLGYLTATLATFFIGRDAEDQAAEIAGRRAVDDLRREIESLRTELRARADP
jgi:voltage-gated potassium channel